MSARGKFLEAVQQLIGQPVVWGHLDCSDLVARGILAASDGKVDQRDTHTAQVYFEATRPLLPAERAVPGDVVFFGDVGKDATRFAAHVIHVAVVLHGGKILSADGATSRITDAVIAAQNPMAKVAVHDSIHFRHDFLAIHRNTLVDSLDAIER